MTFKYYKDIVGFVLDSFRYFYLQCNQCGKLVQWTPFKVDTMV